MSTHNSRKAREAARAAAQTAEHEATLEAGNWFAPKRFGLGSGLPIRWQGWVVYAGYGLALGASGLIEKADFPGNHALAMATFILATTWLLITTARHTRGGWKWRWGSRD